MQRHPVDVILNVGRRLKVARGIKHQAAPGETRRIDDFPCMHHGSAERFIDQLPHRGCTVAKALCLVRRDSQSLRLRSDAIGFLINAGRFIANNIDGIVTRRSDMNGKFKLVRAPEQHRQIFGHTLRRRVPRWYGNGGRAIETKYASFKLDGCGIRNNRRGAQVFGRADCRRNPPQCSEQDCRPYGAAFSGHIQLPQ